jgi:amino acid transporter
LLLIALTIAEVGTRFSQSGGIARYLEYTHGSLTGFLSGWINWLGIVAAIPTEAAASVQYLSSIHGFQGLFNASSGSMSIAGLLVASLLVILYFFLNYWTLQLFLRSTTAVTTFKLIIPLLSVGAIIWAGFQPSNFGHNWQTFAPYGIDAVFIAIAAGGIIFAFNGFQSIVNFAGEAKNPQRTIPIALIASILIC